MAKLLFTCPQGHRWEADPAAAGPAAKECPVCRAAPSQQGTVSPASTPSGSGSQTGVSLPEQFGRYRILKQLGKGGMGAVYLAHDTQLDRKVALKVPHFSPDDGPQVLERFYREARAAATIEHPNICPVYDVGQINGVHYLTMSYIEGRALSDYIDPARPLTQRQIAGLVRKLALALDKAHKKGVIHRDLKPSNVMLNSSGEPVIMDFGLARRVSQGDIRLTKSGAILGTPAYMPPEQVKGDLAAMGPVSDIYSLGVILYELLAQRLPFEGPVTAVLAQILIEEPAAPSAYRSDVDPTLGAICLKAIAKKAEGRYATMGELAGLLTDYLQGKTPPVEARTVPTPVTPKPVRPETKTSGIRVSEMGGLRSMAQAQQQLDSAEKRRRPKGAGRRNRLPLWVWVAGGAGAAAVLLVGILVALSWSGTEQRPEGGGVARGEREPTRPANPPLPRASVPVEPKDDPKPAPPAANEPAKPAIAESPAAKPADFRYFGYFGYGPPEAFPQLAEYTNVLVLGNWLKNGDALLEAARKAGIPVILAAGADDRGNLDKIVPFAKRHRDIVVGVSLDGPYWAGWTPQEVADLGRSLKQQLPGIQYWGAFVDKPRGQYQTNPVPDEVDVIAVSQYNAVTPTAVQAQADDCLPGWLDKAKGRPVLLRWVAHWMAKPGQTVAPGTPRACVNVARKYGLAGVLFASHGVHADRPTMKGIDDQPAVIQEIKDLAAELGFTRRPGQPPGGWISIMPTDEEVSRSSFAKYENGVLHIHGDWAAFGSGKYQAKNAIIRVIVKKLDAQSIDLNLRDTGLTYKAVYSGDRSFAIRKSVSDNGKIRWVDLAEGRSPKPYQDFFEFAFKAVDDLLTIEADGVEVVRVRDSSHDRAGILKFGAFRGQGQFKKAEIKLLDDAAKSSQEPAGLSGVVGKQPQLVRLDELNTPRWDFAPWVSPDGLTIYWEAAEAGTSWIWTASREGPELPFRNKKRLLQGRHPAVTADGLQMILARPQTGGQKRQSLHMATRPTLDRPFGEPREIPELRAANEQEAPWLSADGLVLCFQRSDGAGGNEFWVTTRASLGESWVAPRRLAMAFDRLPDRKITWPHLSADRLTLYCVHEGPVGRGRFMVWSRTSTAIPFADFQYLEIPNIPDLFGRPVRYIEATNELFFSSPRPHPVDHSDWSLWVIRNFRLRRPE